MQALKIKTPGGQNRKFAPFVTLLLVSAVLGVATQSWSQSPTVVNAAVTDKLSDPNNPATYVHTSFARDPTDPNHLVMAFGEANRQAVCGLAQSYDGGRSWTSKILVGRAGEETTFDGGPAQPADFPLPGSGTGDSGLDCASTDAPLTNSPVVDFDSQGTLYYLFTRKRPTCQQPFIAKSTDGGAVFEAPQLVEPVRKCDWNPYLAVDRVNDRVHIVWQRVAQGHPPEAPKGIFIASAERTEKGRELIFTSARVAELASTILHKYPQATVSRDGRTLYVAWHDHTAYTGSGGVAPVLIHVVASVNGGPFSEPVIAAQVNAVCGAGTTPCDAPHYNGAEQSLHSIAAGKDPDQLYMSWWDRPKPGDSNRIYLTQSKDSGKTWASPKMVGVRTGAEAAEHQHRPWISVASDGRVDLAYYTLTQSSQPSQNPLQDVYVTSSCDDELTFSDHSRLTTESSKATVGKKAQTASQIASQGTLVSASTDSGIMAGWTDARLNATRQDVFFGSIDGIPSCPQPELPSISQLIPSQGLTTGGEKVTIVGTKLGGANSVNFDQTSLSCPSPSCTVVSDTKIDVVTPPHAEGTAPVTVKLASTITNALPFTYVSPGGGGGGGAGGPAPPGDPLSVQPNPPGPGAGIQSPPKPPAPPPPAPPAGTGGSAPASAPAPNAAPAPGSMPGPASAPGSSSAPGLSSGAALAPSQQTVLAGVPGIAGRLEEEVEGAANTAYRMTGRSEDLSPGLPLGAGMLVMMALGCILRRNEGLLCPDQEQPAELEVGRPQPQTAY